jgi:hypothetical protein
VFQVYSLANFKGIRVIAAVSGIAFSVSIVYTRSRTSLRFRAFLRFGKIVLWLEPKYRNRPNFRRLVRLRVVCLSPLSYTKPRDYGCQCDGRIWLCNRLSNISKSKYNVGMYYRNSKDYLAQIKSQCGQHKVILDSWYDR